ncbi:MAG: PIN domain-containing protein [Chloroflexota bacterium]|nr:MAG: PIN domain-containing protein [Chloroflexota bacterium]
MKLLDTNVIIYAVGRPHRYKRACARLIRDVSDDSVDFNVDAELLQEVLHVYTFRGERPLGLTVCEKVLSLFPSVLPVGRDEIVVARQLMVRYPQLLPRDAIHAAAVQTNRLEGIVSADRVFDTIQGLVRFDPLVLYPDA